MAEPKGPAIRLSDTYVAERDRMLADLTDAEKELDKLPPLIKGIAKAFYALWRIAGVPLFAAFVGTKNDVKEGLDKLGSGEALKVTITKDDEWFVPILQRMGFGKQTIDGIKALLPEQLKGPVWMPTMLIILYLLNILRPMSNAIIGEDFKDIMSKLHPSVPGAGDVLRAGFIAPELYDSVVKVLKQNGYSEADIKLMFVSRYALEDLSILRDVYFRESKGESWLVERLREHGYTDERIGEIKSVFPAIPPLSDIVMMMAKEAFEPRFQQMFGLRDGYPDELTKWAGAHGLSGDWALRYWISHWQHPGLSQVLDMFHRGYVTKEQMYEYFSLVEIPPFWRERIMATAYNPYTRVDVRRMHAMGVLSDAELKRAYTDLGYNEEKADKMVEWTKKYNQGSEKELSRSDVEKAYEDGDFSFAEAQILLQRIGYSEDLAGFYLARIDVEKERTRRNAKIEVIKEQYLAHLVNSTDTRNALLTAGVRAERVSELMDLWAAALIRNRKLPSKTDLDKLFRSQIIDEDTYVEQMDFLGYKIKYIDWYIELIKKAWEEE